jgi:hypothetical protein
MVRALAFATFISSSVHTNKSISPKKLHPLNTEMPAKTPRTANRTRGLEPQNLASTSVVKVIWRLALLISRRADYPLRTYLCVDPPQPQTRPSVPR